MQQVAHFCKTSDLSFKRLNYSTSYMLYRVNPRSFQWQDVTSYNENRDMIRALQACPRQKSEDSWVISPFIDTKGARNVELEIKYAIRYSNWKRSLIY